MRTKGFPSPNSMVLNPKASLLFFGVTCKQITNTLTQHNKKPKSIGFRTVAARVDKTSMPVWCRQSYGNEEDNYIVCLCVFMLQHPLVNVLEGKLCLPVYTLLSSTIVESSSSWWLLLLLLFVLVLVFTWAQYNNSMIWMRKIKGTIHWINLSENVLFFLEGTYMRHTHTHTHTSQRLRRKWKFSFFL